MSSDEVLKNVNAELKSFPILLEVDETYLVVDLETYLVVDLETYLAVGLLDFEFPPNMSIFI